MNWFFTHADVALNLDLIRSVEFCLTDGVPIVAQIRFTRTTQIEPQPYILSEQDAAKLYIYLKAYSPE